MAAIFGEGKIFLHSLDTPKISTKSLYLARLIEAISVLPFLAKIRKFKMAAIFGEGKFF